MYDTSGNSEQCEQLFYSIRVVRPLPLSGNALAVTLAVSEVSQTMLRFPFSGRTFAGMVTATPTVEWVESPLMTRPNPHGNAVVGRIRQFMREHDMNQSEIIARSKRLGRPIGRATLSRILSGDDLDPRVGTIGAIAAAFGVEAGDLMPSSHREIPEPQRLGAVAFIPTARFEGGKFLKDAMADAIPVSAALFAPGAQFVAYQLTRSVGFEPDVLPGDMLFIELVDPGRMAQVGELVVMGDETNNEIVTGVVLKRERSSYTISNNVKQRSVSTDAILGIVRRVSRDPKRRRP